MALVKLKAWPYQWHFKYLPVFFKIETGFAAELNDESSCLGAKISTARIPETGSEEVSTTVFFPIV